MSQSNEEAKATAIAQIKLNKKILRDIAKVDKACKLRSAHEARIKQLQDDAVSDIDDNIKNMQTTHVQKQQDWEGEMTRRWDELERDRVDIDEQIATEENKKRDIMNGVWNDKLIKNACENDQMCEQKSQDSFAKLTRDTLMYHKKYNMYAMCMHAEGGYFIRCDKYKYAAPLGGIRYKSVHAMVMARHVENPESKAAKGQSHKNWRCKLDENEDDTANWPLFSEI